MTGEHAAIPGAISAEQPHCGVCKHLTFRRDWARTPHCSLRDRDVSISVGDVCVEFAPDRTPDDVGTTDGGDGVDVDWSDRTRGSVAPFYAVYRDDERYGLVCGNCRTLDVAADAMGRITCNECGNTHKPTEWDAAYL